ncbi:SAM-dependent methyltransferase [Aliivibrio fischeri]|uniref:class I SAM-dependent DNA methyltransferase n=1 Tax=Aliivibrio fischeri TaxID=668 RepID=UPI00080E0B97|nr:class I SAM-dependent methyltransferase [Aliivibrio fischeri]OCH30405.1 SAM-dependent methyltransferase [Aliivibrio fischeri]
MSSNALYTDLSGYYDLMCADIDYQSQSNFVRRIHQIFGNQGRDYLDLACGTGPHVHHFINYGYQASGLDINQPMLDIAKQRNPDANFILHDMSNFKVEEPLDLITCFLYSIHYNANIEKLSECIASAHAALKPEGVLCFNSVAKNKIDNRSFVKHAAEHEDSQFSFQSGWNYCGEGEQQHLLLKIEKTTDGVTEIWDDKHPMVAIDFDQLKALLEPYFDVHMFEHDYEKITPLEASSGNAIVVCVKK